jgi:Tfp pilus assembly protein PilF
LKRIISYVTTVKCLQDIKSGQALLIVAAVSVLYGFTLGNGFVWDDHQIIENNPLLSSIAFLPKLLLAEDTFPGMASGYYRPLTYLSFLVDKSIWGNNPLGFTLTNIGLHLLVSLSFYLLITTLFNDKRLALFAALLFSTHPLAAETVNFHAGGRNTLLCSLFIVGAYLSYIKGKQVLPVLLFGLALLSKEFGLLLPPLLLLHDRILAKRSMALQKFLPYVGVAAGYLLVRALIVSTNLVNYLQVKIALITLPQVLATYLTNAFLPFRLKTIYPVDTAFSQLTLAYLAVILLAAACVYKLRRTPAIIFAAAWFGLFLLPVLNIIPVGSSLIADRHVYLSLMGFCLALAWGVTHLQQKLPVIVLTSLLIIYGTTVVVRNSIWKNDESLYVHMTTDAPAMAIGYQNLGMHYYNNGDFDRSLANLREAYSRQDNTPEATFALATLYFETEDYSGALSILDRLIALQPKNIQAYILMSRVHEARGDQVRATATTNRARTLFPNIEAVLEARAYQLCTEGERLAAAGNHPKAARQFKIALILKPDYVPALLDMGSYHAGQGDHEKGLAFFRKVIAVAPNSQAAHYNAYLVYSATGRGEDARRERQLYERLQR